MLKSISRIKNLAVFKDFEWDSTVLDADGRPVFLKLLNIIYGRNYSGKTTLSRIIRSLKTGSISDRYGSPEYTVTLSDGTSVTHASPTDHALEVRVFNEDFVQDHLRVFNNDDESIAAFAVLGEDNAEIVEELAKKEAELGSEYTPGSLRAQESECRKSLERARLKHSNNQDTLDGLLTYKAREIKHNTRYADANYTIRKIRPDITAVTDDSYSKPSDETIAAYEATLLETQKGEVAVCAEPKLGWGTIVSVATELFGRTVKPTDPIQELLDDVILQKWVESGREHHEGKRSRCGFCGGVLPEGLWDKLDRHFSEESKTLQEQLEALVESIDTELDGVPSLLTVDPDDFYSKFAGDAQSLKDKVTDTRNRYTAALTSIRQAAQKRLADIFSSVSMPDTEELADTFQSLWDEYDDLRKKTNIYTTSLSSEHSKSRTALRLNEVSLYLAGIKYKTKCDQIKASEAEVESNAVLQAEAQRMVEKASAVIADLKSKMRDERNGAEKVNEYLNHYFGHPSLRLEAIPDDDDDAGDIQYRFEIQRDGVRAFHLSEGERGLLAFCYFMGRLEDVNTSGTKPIIWIDDPVSSLDENHVFFIYSLIQSHIVEKDIFGQLIVSTHSLTFLKYLKRLNRAAGLERSYYVVERSDDTSRIKQMPKHLKLFATEFHYLFECIYRCAKADDHDEASADAFYSFGNNVRKFLEMYLYFRFPNAENEQDRGFRGPKRLHRFLGDDSVSAALAERVENEYSHLNGLFERGVMPVDIPAMKRMAQLVLDKINEHDSEQYKALLQSIGVDPEDSAVGGGA